MNFVQQIDHRYYQLGRHIEHDERSLAFPAAQAPALKTTVHKRTSPVLNQGNVGSCTGNAMAGLLGTEPFAAPGKVVTEGFALALYSMATHLDSFPGSYPPVDTGSSGLAVAQAAQQLGLIKSYQHAFGIDHACAALVIAPVITGVNWYDSFDRPNSTGLISISPNAGVRGGHEFEVAEIYVEYGIVGCWQSWGPNYAVGGKFYMTIPTWGRLLSERGDVTTVSR